MCTHYIKYKHLILQLRVQLMLAFSVAETFIESFVLVSDLPPISYVLDIFFKNGIETAGKS